MQLIQWKKYGICKVVGSNLTSIYAAFSIGTLNGKIFFGIYFIQTTHRPGREISRKIIIKF
jgi:hypothetical protein